MQIDNSTLRTYTDCNVKGMLSNVLHRKPKVDSEAAWFGKQFHKFIEHYWQPGDTWKEALLEFENKFNLFQQKQAALGRLSEAASAYPEIHLNVAKQFVAQLPRIVSDNGEVILLDAATRHPVYRVRHRPEISFRFPIGDGDEFVGRLDTLLEDFNGALWVCDLKTTGEYNRNNGTNNEAIPRFTWKEQFKMSTQLTGYIRAIQYHTSQTIAGAIVFAIPRAKGKIKIEHIQVRRTEQELEKWEEDTEVLIDRFKRDADYVNKVENGLKYVLPTGKYSGACTRFGICPYFDICHNNYSPGIIEATTVFKLWDPTAPQEEGC